MRVLIDACLPVQLKQQLPFSEVKTARDLGWQRKKNGELLELAQHRFDVLITMDRAMPDQQFIGRFAIAVLILRARSNRLPDVLPLVPEMLRLIPVLKKGQATELRAV
jgi:predicted nuclease of predicted toxin-antitoxin system